MNPFTGRARRDIAFCVLTLPLILPGPVVGFAVTIGLAQAVGPPWVAGGNPSWLAMLTAVAVAVLTAALMVATGKWPPVPDQSNGVITGTGFSRTPGEWLRNDSHQNG